MPLNFGVPLMLVYPSFSTWPWSVMLFFTIFRQIRQSETSIFFVVGMNQAFPIPSATESGTSATDPTCINTSSCLHACSRLESGDAVCRNPVFALATEQLVAIGIRARQV